MLVIRDDILLIYLLCKLMLMRIRWTKCIYLQSLFDDRPLERAQSQFASNPLKIAIRCARCSLLAAIDLHLKRSPSITQPFIISCIVYIRTNAHDDSSANIVCYINSLLCCGQKGVRTHLIIQFINHPVQISRHRYKIAL